MSGRELSKAVAEAADFLYEIHESTRAMLVSVEAGMENAGWKPLTKKITDQNLNSTLQGQWMLWWFYRMYVPKDCDEKFKRLVLISGGFGAEPGGYASLTASAVRFSRPTTYTEVWDNWTGTASVCRATDGQPGVVTLTPADFADLTPFARAAAAITFPLCELGSEADLRKRLIEPILTAEAQLGAAP